MKKLLTAAFLCLFLAFGSSADAQKKVKEAGKKTGHKTAEVTSKGKNKVFDAVVKDKTGPNNETIYLDGKSRYYWIDKKGKKHYVPKSSLKNKVDDD